MHVFVDDSVHLEKNGHFEPKNLKKKYLFFLIKIGVCFKMSYRIFKIFNVSACFSSSRA